MTVRRSLKALLFLAVPLAVRAEVSLVQVTNPVRISTATAIQTVIIGVSTAPASATQYLPVRLTDGAAYYTAGGGGGSSVTVVNVATVTFNGSAQPVSISGTPTVNATQSGAWSITNSTVGVTDAGGSLTVDSAQLPGALDGSGFLKVHEQGTAAVSGTVTANAGTGDFSVNGSTLAVTNVSAQNLNVAVANTPTVNAAQSGTWTVQPGNTANTTPWLIQAPGVATAANDGSCATVTTSSSNLLASNSSRRYCAVMARMSNTDTVFMKLGTTATTADFPLEPGQVFNLPRNVVYTGAVDAISNSGSQSVCVVELN